jgi:hypothetical protein
MGGLAEIWPCGRWLAVLFGFLAFTGDIGEVPFTRLAFFAVNIAIAWRTVTGSFAVLG